VFNFPNANSQEFRPSSKFESAQNHNPNIIADDQNDDSNAVKYTSRFDI